MEILINNNIKIKSNNYIKLKIFASTCLTFLFGANKK